MILDTEKLDKLNAQIAALVQAYDAIDQAAVSLGAAAHPDLRDDSLDEFQNRIASTIAELSSERADLTHSWVTGGAR